MKNLFKFSCIFIVGMSNGFCSIATFQTSKLFPGVGGGNICLRCKNLNLESKTALELELQNQKEYVGWQNDDSTLTSRQLLKLYAEHEGEKFYIEQEAKFRDDPIQEYVKESEFVQDFGRLTFSNGVLEQKKIATIDYRRPDGSLYKIENVPVQSEIQQIPHSVTYSPNCGWQITENNFIQGTFKQLKGAFAIVNENILTKYQLDGTVVKRPATPEELAAFLPTKTIPHYWISIRNYWPKMMLCSGYMPYIDVLIKAPYDKHSGYYSGHSWTIDPKFLNTYAKGSVNWDAIMASE